MLREQHLATHTRRTRSARRFDTDYWIAYATATETGKAIPVQRPGHLQLVVVNGKRIAAWLGLTGIAEGIRRWTNAHPMVAGNLMSIAAVTVLGVLYAVFTPDTGPHYGPDGPPRPAPSHSASVPADPARLITPAPSVSVPTDPAAEDVLPDTSMPTPSPSATGPTAQAGEPTGEPSGRPTGERSAAPTPGQPPRSSKPSANPTPEPTSTSDIPRHRIHLCLDHIAPIMHQKWCIGLLRLPSIEGT